MFEYVLILNITRRGANILFFLLRAIVYNSNMEQQTLLHERKDLVTSPDEITYIKKQVPVKQTFSMTTLTLNPNLIPV
ncbi:unnamed protein product [Didymodactylos carnosus]|uniref:Uncharacterized protein n=1 Tax=Didymodactylos carnosus TaxID=1234261 RepID=A0A813Y1P3_9BILA|nr:unnamed protein product [Didymodactylos carnosus]CAF0875527.1 unnamed protein product [Didymodactylos carnosus]CAF3563178.1 unnamed protein product [Didymodactylos carnosus]CAF3662432.1 unnamed protein product [Didymodactylos carnosus]